MSSTGLPAPPIEPMLAKIADALPTEPGFLFEPKWDGFRALVFRGAEQTYLQSRDLRPLNRYFPELEKALHEALPKGCVLDGEIVVARPSGLDFDALQMRPASGRLARGQAGEGDARPASSPSTCWPPAASPPWSCRSRNGAPGLERLLGQGQAAAAPDAGHARPRPGRGVAGASSKAPASTA
jgi:hypothetical protein